MKENKMAEESSLVTYINSLIDERLETWDTKLKEEDAKEIVEALIPEIEKVVSRIVLKHIKAIAIYAINKLKED
jgi:(2Fe-2S) ferredoxin